MKIKELLQWPKIYLLARLYIHKGVTEEYDLSSSIVFENTPQRHYFWSFLNSNQIEKAKALYPDLFEIKLEDCLEIARIRYPKGTEYKTVYPGKHETYIVENPNRFTSRAFENGTIDGEHGKGVLYMNGYWAEILSTSTQGAPSSESKPVPYISRHKFKVGDIVRIKAAGWGCSNNSVGELVVIKELKTFKSGALGYEVSNPKKGIISPPCDERSFELYSCDPLLPPTISSVDIWEATKKEFFYPWDENFSMKDSTTVSQALTSVSADIPILIHRKKVPIKKGFQATKINSIFS